MSEEEHEEQARKLDEFHDKHSYQTPPDWLKAEAEAEVAEAAKKPHTYNLGDHTVELDEQSGVLTLSGFGQRTRLSADETYRLLVLLQDNYREMLHKLARPDQGRDPAAT
jgi:hypothetical protein